MVSVYLDGILIKDTPKFKDAKETIYLDDSLKAWIVKYNDFPIEFWGDGFVYLKGLKKTYGYNYKVSVKIVVSTDSGEAGFGDILYSEIPLTDLVILHTQNKATVKFITQDFQGKIQTNGDVDVSLLNVEKSINGVDISAVTPPQLNIQLFDAATGIHDGNDRYGVSLQDAIKFLLYYITDGTLDYEDNFFTDADNELATKYGLLTTREMRLYDHEDGYAVISNFNTVMQNAFKLFNCWWYIDYTERRPKFVLDSYRRIYGVQDIVEVPLVKNIEESFYQPNFFTDIKIGSPQFRNPVPADNSYIKYIYGFTHREENFHGKNNTLINQTFDLLSDWLFEHNLIQFIWDAPTVDIYDGSVFVIETDEDGLAIPYEYELLEGDPYRRYNQTILNYYRLARFKLPVNVGFDSGSVNDNFEATLSADLPTTSLGAIMPVEFDNELSDPNNNYDPVTFQYTAPVTGNYGFAIDMRAQVSGLTSGNEYRYRLRLYQRYASGTFKTMRLSDSFHVTSNTGAEGFQFLFSFNMLMNATDTMEAWLDVLTLGGGASTAYIMKDVSKFYTTYVQNQGGLIQAETNIKNYYGSILKIENYNIPLNTWKQLRRKPILDLRVTKHGGYYAICKIKEIERDILTGQCGTFDLITKGDQIVL